MTVLVMLVWAVGSGFGGGGMNMEDIFSQFGDILAAEAVLADSVDLAAEVNEVVVNRGSNIRCKVKLTLKDIVNGVEKKIKVKNTFLVKHVLVLVQKEAVVLILVINVMEVVKLLESRIRFRPNANRIYLSKMWWRRKNNHQ